MSSILIKLLGLLTGTVVAGEALALLVGMVFLSPKGNPWISTKNSVLLGLDILTGLGMVVLIVLLHRMDVIYLFYGCVLLSILTHGYREVEYLVRAGNPFCINTPLFIVNSIKLAGLVVIGLAMRELLFTPRIR